MATIFLLRLVSFSQQHCLLLHILIASGFKATTCNNFFVVAKSTFGNNTQYKTTNLFVGTFLSCSVYYYLNALRYLASYARTPRRDGSVGNTVCHLEWLKHSFWSQTTDQ